MPKSRRRKSKSHKVRHRPPRKPAPTRPPEQTSQTGQFSIWRLTWKIVGAVSIVVGLLVGVLALIPWFSIDIDEPLNPRNPYSSPFYLVSESYLPLYNILVTRQITTETRTHLRFEDVGVVCIEPIDRLTYKKKIALPCLHAIRIEGAVMAEMTLHISYQPFGLPFRRAQEFRFRAEPTSDGTLRWLFNNQTNGDPSLSIDPKIQIRTLPNAEMLLSIKRMILSRGENSNYDRKLD